jgi:multidrug resistance efflux pump
MVLKNDSPIFVPAEVDTKGLAKKLASPKHVPTVHRLQAALKTAVEHPAPGEPQEVNDPRLETDALDRKGLPNNTLWRLAKAAIAISLIVIVGWEPLQALLQPASVEAVVNARLVTLKSPIAGEIMADHLPQSGDIITNGSLLLRVHNPRTDRTRLDDISRALIRAENERIILVEKRQWAVSRRAALLLQLKAFADARMHELSAKKEELGSELEVAKARNIEAQSALVRAHSLADQNSISEVDLERSERDAAVGAALVGVARNRIANVSVELEALKAGTFVGDSYNDRPSTAQMADDLAVRIADLDAEIKTLDSREKNLTTDLAEEEQRFAYLSRFDLTVPVNGRVWEIMTAPGEQVATGQDLIKLLDCSGAVVTASVSESVYNYLRVGMTARFRFREDSNDHIGEVVNLTGVAGAAANLAIAPSALVKEPYRVTVAVPDLKAGPSCNIGQTGRVYFNEKARPGFSLTSLLH